VPLTASGVVARSNNTALLWSNDIENWSLVSIFATPFQEQRSVSRLSRAQFIRIPTVHCCRIIWIFAKELASDCIDDIALSIAMMDDGDVGRLDWMQAECARLGQSQRGPANRIGHGQQSRGICGSRALQRLAQNFQSLLRRLSRHFDGALLEFQLFALALFGDIELRLLIGFDGALAILKLHLTNALLPAVSL
jgi:hypothetical protein